MIELPPCKIVTVVGPVASGKTHLLKQWLASQNRVVVFDSTGEMLTEHGFVQCWMNPRHLIDILQTSPYYFRVSYVPGPRIASDFHWVVKVMWQFDSVKLLAVDEAHLIFPNNAIDEDVEMLLRFARHAKLGLVCMSQRFQDIHKLLISSSRMVIIFQTRDARAFEAVRAEYGLDIAEKVRNLRPLIHDDSTGITSQLPQCMVCTQDGNRRVYDFAEDRFLDGKLESNRDTDGRDSSSLAGEIPSEESSSNVDVDNEPSREEL